MKMFEKLANTVFTKKIRSFVNDGKRLKMFVNYEQAKSVFLLFESNFSEKNPEIKRLVEMLVADGKVVTAWGYVPKKQIMSNDHHDFRILCRRDFDHLQRPKQSIIQDLQHVSYDLLIDITSRHFLTMDYMIIYANAKCRAGIKKTEINIYDFAVELPDFESVEQKEHTDDDYLYNFNQLIFYLRNIQTKDY
jgi:hypothetical protein